MTTINKNYFGGDQFLLNQSNAIHKLNQNNTITQNGNNYSMSSEAAQVFFNNIISNLGSNGKVSVALLTKEIATLNTQLQDTSLSSVQRATIKEEMGMLNAIKGTDGANGDGFVTIGEADTLIENGTDFNFEADNGTQPTGNNYGQTNQQNTSIAASMGASINSSGTNNTNIAANMGASVNSSNSSPRATDVGSSTSVEANMEVSIDSAQRASDIVSSNRTNIEASLAVALNSAGSSSTNMFLSLSLDQGGNKTDISIQLQVAIQNSNGQLSNPNTQGGGYGNDRNYNNGDTRHSGGHRRFGRLGNEGQTLNQRGISFNGGSNNIATNGLNQYNPGIRAPQPNVVNNYNTVNNNYNGDVTNNQTNGNVTNNQITNNTVNNQTDNSVTNTQNVSSVANNQVDNSLTSITNDNRVANTQIDNSTTNTQNVSSVSNRQVDRSLTNTQITKTVEELLLAQ